MLLVINRPLSRIKQSAFLSPIASIVNFCRLFGIMSPVNEADAALSEAYHYDGHKLGAQLSAIARRNFGIVYRYGSHDHARF